jgi:hypothetical protein
MIDTTHAEPEAHRCSPPPIRTWDDKAEDVFATVRHLPIGTRFTCEDCGRVAVVVMEPEIITRTMVVCARRVWQEESRRQRRQRLGLRWWQRGAPNGKAILH